MGRPLLGAGDKDACGHGRPRGLDFRSHHTSSFPVAPCLGIRKLLSAYAVSVGASRPQPLVDHRPTRGPAQSTAGAASFRPSAVEPSARFLAVAAYYRLARRCGRKGIAATAQLYDPRRWSTKVAVAFAPSMSGPGFWCARGSVRTRGSGGCGRGPGPTPVRSTRATCAAL